MKNEKFCFNKSVGVIIAVVIALGAFALFAFKLSTQSTSTSTRASAPEKNVQPNNALPIIGGEPAKDGEFPFMAALLHTEKLVKNSDDVYSAFFCGGTLIAPQFILTAAHCVKKYEETPEKITVSLNFTNLRKSKSTSNRIGINQIFIHEDYMTDTYNYTVNDIAILRLNTRISTDTSFLPWLNNNNLIFNGNKGTVIGWGSTTPTVDNSTQNASENLLKTSALIKTFNDTLLNHKNRFGASYNNMQIISRGDSGSPFIIEDEGKKYIAGIVSTVGDKILEYGIFTDVTKYSNWISGILTVHSSSQ